MKNILSSYKDYKEKKGILNKKAFNELNIGYMQFITDLIKKGDLVHLPLGMGFLVIQGSKSKIKRNKEGKIVGIPIDWVKTKKMWEEDEKAKEEKKLIYIANSITDGYKYKWFWSKRKIALKVLNKRNYYLRISRKNKRATWANIINGVEYRNKF